MYSCHKFKMYIFTNKIYYYQCNAKVLATVQLLSKKQLNFEL